MRYHPHRHIDMPVSQGVYHSLLTASAETGFQKECWEIVEAAIRDWMVRHHPESFSNPKVAGYQWKDVFLPKGTLLRTVFGGKNYHCTVEADHILYRGASVSPSGFVNAVGGVRRNAWKVVWVLLPDTLSWELAGTMRARRQVIRKQRARAPASQPGHAE